ncbi:hypothetical protein JKP88DRAFT_337150 [Tribonema minus]|uniref:Pentatricopeptide repeat-containing protein n=1 Tax=Tribonema minus TaxID=303371 RepID=A0A836C8M4_9STRA|nr:hypothetical protein JKP88DRAFT_337150 [Tribonema minus]
MGRVAAAALRQGCRSLKPPRAGVPTCTDLVPAISTARTGTRSLSSGTSQPAEYTSQRQQHEQQQQQRSRVGSAIHSRHVLHHNYLPCQVCGGLYGATRGPARAASSLRENDDAADWHFQHFVPETDWQEKPLAAAQAQGGGADGGQEQLSKHADDQLDEAHSLAARADEQRVLALVPDALERIAKLLASRQQLQEAVAELESLCPQLPRRLPGSVKGPLLNRHTNDRLDARMPPQPGMRTPFCQNGMTYSDTKAAISQQGCRQKAHGAALRMCERDGLWRAAAALVRAPVTPDGRPTERALALAARAAAAAGAWRGAAAVLAACTSAGAAPPSDACHAALEAMAARARWREAVATVRAMNGPLRGAFDFLRDGDGGGGDGNGGDGGGGGGGGSGGGSGGGGGGGGSAHDSEVDGQLHGGRASWDVGGHLSEAIVWDVDRAPRAERRLLLAFLRVLWEPARNHWQVGAAAASSDSSGSSSSSEVRGAETAGSPADQPTAAAAAAAGSGDGSDAEQRMPEATVAMVRDALTACHHAGAFEAAFALLADASRAHARSSSGGGGGGGRGAFTSKKAAAAVAGDARCHNAALCACAQAGAWGPALSLLGAMGAAPLALAQQIAALERAPLRLPWAQGAAAAEGSMATHPRGRAAAAARARSGISKSDWTARRAREAAERSSVSALSPEVMGKAAAAAAGAAVAAPARTRARAGSAAAAAAASAAAAAAAAPHAEPWRMEGRAAPPPPPDAGTYSAVMAALTRAKLWRGALRLLQELRSGRCGGAAATKETYEAVLEACAANGRATEAVALLKRMRADSGGLAPSVPAYNAALRACAGAGQIARARAVLDEMLCADAESHLLVARAAAAAAAWAAAEGLLAAALRAPRADVTTLEAALRVLTVGDGAGRTRVGAAVRLLEAARRIEDEGGAAAPQLLTARAVNVVLNMCAEARDWRRAIALLQAITKGSGSGALRVRADTRTFNAVLKALAAAGAKPFEESAFICGRSTPKTLLKCVARQVNVSPQAMRKTPVLLQSRQQRVQHSPRLAAYELSPSSELHTCSTEREKAMELSDAMPRLGVRRDRDTYTALLHAIRMSDGGTWEEARELLTGLRGTGRRVSGSALNAAARAIAKESPAHARAVARAMRRRDFPILPSTFTAVAPRRSGSGAAVFDDYRALMKREPEVDEEVEEVLGRGGRKWLNLKKSDKLRTIQCLADHSCEQPRCALCTLCTQPSSLKPPIEFYISGMRIAGDSDWDSVLEVAEDVEDRGFSNSEEMILHLVMQCGYFNRPAVALQLLERARARGRLNAPVLNAVLWTLARTGKWEDALELVWISSGKLSAAVLNAVLWALARTGKWEDALELVRRLHKDPKHWGILPDLSSVALALRACADAGRWQEALKFIDDMHNQGVSIDERCLRAAVRACAQAGAWQAATHLLYGMLRDGPEPSVLAFYAAVTACVNGGEKRVRRYHGRSLRLHCASHCCAVAEAGGSVIASHANAAGLNGQPLPPKRLSKRRLRLPTKKAESAKKRVTSWGKKRSTTRSSCCVRSATRASYARLQTCLARDSIMYCVVQIIAPSSIILSGMPFCAMSLRHVKALPNDDSEEQYAAQSAGCASSTLSFGGSRRS